MGISFPAFLLSLFLLVLLRDYIPWQIRGYYGNSYIFIIPIQMVTYIICVAKNKFFDRGNKLLWSLIILGTLGLSSPVYWILHIRKSDMAEFLKPQKNDKTIIIVLTVITYLLGIFALLIFFYYVPAEFIALLAGVNVIITGFYSIILSIVYCFRNKLLNSQKTRFIIPVLIFVHILIYIFYVVVFVYNCIFMFVGAFV